MKNNKKNTTRFLFTGGHITPALSLLEELKQRGYSDFLWVGRKKTMRKDLNTSAEYRIIHDEMNIPFIHSLTGKLIRISSINTFFEFLINIVFVGIGCIQAFHILLKYKPQCIISFGGYIPIPIVIVGKLLGIPSVTHEQTTVVGMANKILSRFATKVFLSWKQSMNYVPSSKALLVGNPIRKEILEVKTHMFKLNSHLPTLYITGGNQGAHVINKTVKPILKKLLDRMNIIHQTGATTVTRDYQTHREIENKLRGITKGVYIVRDFIFGVEIGEVFSNADIILSRSGANICTDILATAKLSILIPIPWSFGNEQVHNAEMLEDLGIAKLIEEGTLNSELLLEALYDAITRVNNHIDFKNKHLENTRKRAKSMVQIDAQVVMADQIEKLVNN